MGSTFSTPAVVTGTILTQAIMDELKTQINNENSRRGFTSSTDVIESTSTAGTNITSSINIIKKV